MAFSYHGIPGRVKYILRSTATGPAKKKSGGAQRTPPDMPPKR